MKHTGISLRDHYFELIPNMRFISEVEKFPTFLDFSPHHETFNGHAPFVYLFRNNYSKGITKWLEVKDGYFTLLPLLLENKNLDHLILPQEARYILDKFHYSILEYKEQSPQIKQCFIHLDIYKEYLFEKNFADKERKIQEISSQYESVSLAISLSSNTTLANQNDKMIFDFIRALPSNIRVISTQEFLQKKSFTDAAVYLLTDEIFILKSPWENILASRGAFIKQTKINKDDQEVDRYIINENCSRVIYKTTKQTPLAKEVQDHLLKLHQDIRNEEGYLHPEYLRYINNIVRNLGMGHV